MELDDFPLRVGADYVLMARHPDDNHLTYFAAVWTGSRFLTNDDQDSLSKYEIEQYAILPVLPGYETETDT